MKYRKSCEYGQFREGRSKDFRRKLIVYTVALYKAKVSLVSSISCESLPILKS